MIVIEVAYASISEQVLLSCKVPVGTTVDQAILVSGILEQFPEIDLSKNGLGIFSKKITRDTVLQSGDRIEIYRPLLIDPKEARRLKAAKKFKNT